MENKQSEFLEIDLRQIFLALWSRAWLIILVGVLIAALALSYAMFFVTPTYAASIQLYVNNNYESPGFSSSQLVAAQSLADTYMVILESRAVLDKVAKQTNLGYNYGQLKNMVSAASVNDTEIFMVSVVSTNYKHSTQIANTIAEILPNQISAVVYGSTVSVVDYAVENPKPVGPDYGNYMIMGALLGAFFTAAIVVLLEMQNTAIYSEEYLAQVYSEVPLLAVVPGAESSKSAYYKGYYEAQKKRPADKKTGGGKV